MAAQNINTRYSCEKCEAERVQIRTYVPSYVNHSESQQMSKL